MTKLSIVLDIETEFLESEDGAKAASIILDAAQEHVLEEYLRSILGNIRMAIGNKGTILQAEVASKPSEYSMASEDMQDFDELDQDELLDLDVPDDYDDIDIEDEMSSRVKDIFSAIYQIDERAEDNIIINIPAEQSLIEEFEKHAEDIFPEKVLVLTPSDDLKNEFSLVFSDIGDSIDDEAKILKYNFT